MRYSRVIIRIETRDTVCSKSVLNEITDKVVKAAKESLGDKLDKVILYGSYARGDFTDESDIDIMVIADVRLEDRHKVYDMIWSVTGDMDLEYDVIVSVHVADCVTYYRFINDLPFYININTEGILLSA